MEKGNNEQSVTLKICYNGSFQLVGGNLVYISKCSRTVGVIVDEFCWFSIVEEVEKTCEFKRDVDAIYFMNPSIGIQRALNDNDTRIMCDYGVVHRVVDCYVVVESDISKVSQLIECGKQYSIEVNKRQKLTPRRRVDSGPKEGVNEVAFPTETLEESHPKSKSKDAFDTPSQNTPSKKTQTSASENTSSKKSAKKRISYSSEVLRTSPRLASNKIIIGVSQPDLITSKPTDTSPLNYPPLISSSYDFNELTISKFYDAYEEECDLAGLEELGKGPSQGVSEGSDSDTGYEPEFEEGSTDGADDDYTDQVAEEELDGEDVLGLEGVDEVPENLIEEELASDGNTDDDDEVVEARKKVKAWNANALKIAKQLQVEASAGQLHGQQTEGVQQPTAPRDGQVSDYDESGEEIDTPCESEEESIPGKRKISTVPVITDRTDFSKLKWVVGIKFPSRELFRDCVARYAIAQGRNCAFDISDKKRGKRLRVRCVPGCPFKLYGSWDNKSASFVVKSVDPNHTCLKTMSSNRQLKSSWIAKQLLDVFKARPHWPASEIVDTVRKAYKVLIKRGFAYKIKYHAHRMLHGSMREHYSKLGSYVGELQKRNGTSQFCLYNNPDIPRNPPVFQRFFVCFDALKSGWLAGCRRLLCVDACFLKTFLGGQLISAVGRDGNEQMYPLAWAVVEGENNNSYEWFFQQLKTSLGEEDGDGWTIISDQHPVRLPFLLVNIFAGHDLVKELKSFISTYCWS